MARFAVLLRGVNLGGHNRLPMRAFTSVLEAAGCTQVATYVQSGNAVVTSRRSVESLTTAVEAGLAAIGVAVPAVVVAGTLLHAVVDQRPVEPPDGDPAKLHVVFFAPGADMSRVAALERATYAPDTFHVDGNVVYLSCPNGFGVSKLTTTLWDRWSGVPSTVRNWRTVLAVHDLARSVR